MDKLRKFINTPINRSNYLLFLLVAVILNFTIPHFLFLLKIYGTQIETLTKTPSVWNFPALSFIYAVAGLVFGYKRLIDFCNKKIAIFVTILSGVASIYIHYVYYFIGIYQVRNKPSYILFVYLILVLFLIVIFKKGNTNK